MEPRKIRLDEVKVELLATEEDVNFIGHFNSFESSDRKRLESEIRSRLERGDLWAWCTVAVTVRWNGLNGVAFLGCCSYDSEEDFKKDGYYEDMVNDAMTDLNDGVRKTWLQIAELFPKPA